MTYDNTCKISATGQATKISCQLSSDVVNGSTNSTTGTPSTSSNGNEEEKVTGSSSRAGSMREVLGSLLAIVAFF